MKLTYFIFLNLFISLPLLAKTCESNFETLGDPRNGAAFSTSANIPDVTPAVALGQLRGIAVKDGFNVLSEESNAQTGTLAIEQTKGVRHPFLIHFTATAKGTASEVSVETQLKKKVTAKPEDIRQGMCGMLARIKSGKEGEALAAKAHAEAPKAKVTVVKAITLSREFDRVIKKYTAEEITARYKGKVYQLDGQIKEPLETDGTVEIWYDVFREANWLMPGELGAETSRTSIVCRLAKDQLKHAKYIKADNSVKLTGTVSHFFSGTPHKLVFENCRLN
jgi:hypothetical protein